MLLLSQLEASGLLRRQESITQGGGGGIAGAIKRCKLLEDQAGLEPSGNIQDLYHQSYGYAYGGYKPLSVWLVDSALRKSWAAGDAKVPGGQQGAPGRSPFDVQWTVGKGGKPVVKPNLAAPALESEGTDAAGLVLVLGYGN